MRTGPHKELTEYRHRMFFLFALFQMSDASARAAQLRGKTEVPPARRALLPSQRATLWRSTARSRRRSSVHAGAQSAKDGIDRTGNSVVGSADGVFREEFS